MCYVLWCLVCTYTVYQCNVFYSPAACDMLGVLIVYLSHLVDRLISKPAHSIFKEEGGGFIHNNIEYYVISIMYTEHAFDKGLKKNFISI